FHYRCFPLPAFQPKHHRPGFHTFWKNDVNYHLLGSNSNTARSTGSRGYGITVVGNDVYVVGNSSFHRNIGSTPVY
ncbi:MAG: hypothetical protein LBB61_09645, partial [Treponema sp.]|nr:hypothetical protein [Treponema sp.]